MKIPIPRWLDRWTRGEGPRKRPEKEPPPPLLVREVMADPLQEPDLFPDLEPWELRALRGRRPGFRSVPTLSVEDMVVLDIETRDLSKPRSPIWMVGLLCRQGKRVCIRQMIATSPAYERELLVELNRQLSKFRCVVTFYGRGFDYPRLEEAMLYY